MACSYFQDFAGFNTNDFVYIKKGIFFVQHTHAAMNFVILALKDLLLRSIRVCGISFHSVAPILCTSCAFK